MILRNGIKKRQNRVEQEDDGHSHPVKKCFKTGCRPLEIAGSICLSCCLLGINLPVQPQGFNSYIEPIIIHFTTVSPVRRQLGQGLETALPYKKALLIKIRFSADTQFFDLRV